MKSSSGTSQKLKDLKEWNVWALLLKKKFFRNALIPHFTRLYTNCQSNGLALKFQEDDLRNCHFTFRCGHNLLKSEINFLIKN
jgi:hypothetical protein